MAGSPFARFGLPAGPATGNRGRSSHLEFLQRLRTEQPKLPDLDCGAAMLSIPELDYYVLLERFPDLKSPDTEIKRRAWIKLANSEVGRIYRVKDRPTQIRK